MRSHVHSPGFQHSGINKVLWLVFKSIPFQRVKILIPDTKKKNAVEGKSEMQEVSQGFKTNLRQNNRKSAR
jgi:hypothetical protein